MAVFGILYALHNAKKNKTFSVQNLNVCNFPNYTYSTTVKQYT